MEVIEKFETQHTHVLDNDLSCKLLDEDHHHFIQHSSSSVKNMMKSGQDQLIVFLNGILQLVLKKSHAVSYK